MNSQTTITIQEVRRNLPDFLERLNKGEVLTVIAHSRPVVTIKAEDGQNRSMQTAKFLQSVRAARSHATRKLDPAKSYKQLYAENIADKYDLS